VGLEIGEGIPASIRPQERVRDDEWGRSQVRVAGRRRRVDKDMDRGSYGRVGSEGGPSIVLGVGATVGGLIIRPPSIRSYPRRPGTEMMEKTYGTRIRNDQADQEQSR
jgi:hypothetical protein